MRRSSPSCSTASWSTSERALIQVHLSVGVAGWHLCMICDRSIARWALSERRICSCTGLHGGSHVWILALLRRARLHDLLAWLQQRSAGVRIASGRAVKGICGINFSVTSYAWLMCVCACCSVCSAVPPPVFVRAKNAADALCVVPYPPLA